MDNQQEAFRVLDHWRLQHVPVDLVVTSKELGATAHVMGWLVTDGDVDMIHGGDAIVAMPLFSSLAEAERIEVAMTEKGTIVNVHYPQGSVRLADYGIGEAIGHA